MYTVTVRFRKFCGLIFENKTCLHISDKKKWFHATNCLVLFFLASSKFKLQSDKETKNQRNKKWFTNLETTQSLNVHDLFGYWILMCPQWNTIIKCARVSKCVVILRQQKKNHESTNKHRSIDFGPQFARRWCVFLLPSSIEAAVFFSHTHAFNVAIHKIHGISSIICQILMRIFCFVVFIRKIDRITSDFSLYWLITSIIYLSIFRRPKNSSDEAKKSEQNLIENKKRNANNFLIKIEKIEISHILLSQESRNGFSPQPQKMEKEMKNN